MYVCYCSLIVTHHVTNTNFLFRTNAFEVRHPCGVSVDVSCYYLNRRCSVASQPHCILNRRCSVASQPHCILNRRCSVASQPHCILNRRCSVASQPHCILNRRCSVASQPHCILPDSHTYCIHVCPLHGTARPLNRR